MHKNLKTKENQRTDPNILSRSSSRWTSVPTLPTTNPLRVSRWQYFSRILKLIDILRCPTATWVSSPGRTPGRTGTPAWRAAPPSTSPPSPPTWTSSTPTATSRKWISFYSRGENLSWALDCGPDTQSSPLLPFSSALFSPDCSQGSNVQQCLFTFSNILQNEKLGGKIDKWNTISDAWGRKKLFQLSILRSGACKRRN